MAEPPHGSAARYDHGTSTEPPCREECCRKAKLEARRRHSKAVAYGRPTMTDAAPAAAHAQTLLAAGMTIVQIAEASGVAAGAVRRLLGRDADRVASKKVRVTTAQKLLATRPTTERWAGGDSVPAHGTRRRIQALVAAGRPLSAITAELGTSYSQIHEIVHGTRERVRVRTYRAVHDLTERWWNEPPPQATEAERDLLKGAQRLAAKHGWVPIACWDNPDDATEVPKGAPKLRKRP